MVGASIVRPIKSITDVMQQLSAGKTDVEIGHRDRRDEIGKMVQAIDVFRTNMIEIHSMEQATPPGRAASRGRAPRRHARARRRIREIRAAHRRRADRGGRRDAQQCRGHVADRGANARQIAVDRRHRHRHADQRHLGGGRRRRAGEIDRAARGANPKRARTHQQDRGGIGERQRQRPAVARRPSARSFRSPASFRRSRSRPTCWRSTRPSRRRARAPPARASPWSRPR